MEIKDILEILNKDNVNFNLYFCRKLKNGKYVTFSPNVDNQIFDDLLTLIIQYIVKFSNFDIVNYSPIGIKDETLEKYSTDKIHNYSEILNSLNNSNNVETEMDISNSNFYILEAYSDKFNIKLFRRLTKFKKLSSSGIIAKYNGKILNKIESKIIGLDSEVDLIVVNDTDIKILSHYSFQTIFNLEDQFKDVANQFLRQDSLKRGISNYQNFYEDCLESSRYRKVITKMSDENIDIDQLYQNSKNIKTTIELFDLDLEYIETPFSLIYNDKSQINEILRIFRDCYYKSTINEKKGIDEKIN